jgi:NAD(P)-dependent dehydrogenase (short-subunit alcohol dehydrogenase family)
MLMAQKGSRPKNPLPKQKQRRPGIESKIDPRPQFLAPDYKGSGKLKGKVALITGGDSGYRTLGRRALTHAKGRMSLSPFFPSNARMRKRRPPYVEKEGRRCLLLSGDVADPAVCRKWVSKTVKEFGRLDILVNNAAFQQHQPSITDITNEQFDKTFKTNIYGYFYMAKAAIEHIPKGGSIINCGSITGLEGSKELIDYSATKGAIHAFTKALAQNLAEKGIRVNCVSPGPVWTPLNIADKDRRT